MTNYVLRRLFIAIFVLFGITLIDFSLINLAPGNPLDMMIDPEMTQEARDIKLKALGLDEPVAVRYLHWLGDLCRGNLGYSLTTYRPVSQMIAERLGPTLLLMGASLILGLLIAIPLGILSATRQDTAVDYIATGGAFLGISVPNFFMALILIFVFSLKLHWLPTGGIATLGGDGGIVDLIRHMALPVAVLSVSIAGRNVRYVRGALLDILGQDYLRTARAKGVSESHVIRIHAFRNALLPVITVIGLEIPALFGGAVITEQIFAWPGIGRLTIDSILTRDYPTIMGLNLMTAVIILLANLATDLAYSLVDPRIKYS